MTAPGSCWQRLALIAVVFLALTAFPRFPRAACVVMINGTVNCGVDTTTTKTTNVDGNKSSSSARTQRFHNGVPINGTVQPGITVSGFGLQLTEKPGGKKTQEPITMNNQGQVTISNRASALQLQGDGGLISYSGDGGISNTDKNKPALEVKNVHGDVSVTSGAGAISGSTGIKASVTGPGTLAVTTGSGLVSGTANEDILASTGNGALSVTVGSGGVLGAPPRTNGAAAPPAVKAVSSGKGNIVENASGPIFAPGGIGMWASENASARGGILMLGTGDTSGLGPICPGGPGAFARGAAHGEIGCPGIFVQIQNKEDRSNLVIDRSGTVVGTSAAIAALDAGNGNVLVSTGMNSLLTGIYEFGILAQPSGKGSASISTGVGSSITTAGTGILVTNLADKIPVTAGSFIAVTNDAAITSSASPVDGVVNPKNPTGVLAGISAAYVGGRAATPNRKVHGSINVVNDAPIIMAGGDGVLASNFGKGNVSVTSAAPIVVTGATSRTGIEAFSAGHGNISVATGQGETAAAIGINASAKGAGTLAITTGSGSVSGTSSEGILASTANGTLNLTVGSGGVESPVGDAPAIDLRSKNGNISAIANGPVTANGSIKNPTDDIAYGILATSHGLGGIVVGGSGTVFGEARGIFALESHTAFGGVLVTGTGDTISARQSAFSALRAEIENPDDSSNVIVDRSGNVFAISSPDDAATHDSAAIHAITAGTGNVIVQGGTDATIANNGLFGIDATAFGRNSSGNIIVSTGTAGTLSSGGTGILAVNQAFVIPQIFGSAITVTANGTINSGAALNPVGFTRTGGSGATAVPAGIIAGYDGRPKFKPTRGPYTSCDFFGCTTLTPDRKVTGAVNVFNNAVINAGGGDGIFAFNFGNGNVSVTSSGPITVAGATGQNGIQAFSAEVGNISVSTMANVTGGNGSGILTTSAGTATTTVNVLAGSTQGATSGVTAASASGAIQINNWATIQNLSGQPGALAVATSGAGNATLSNNAGGVVTGTVSMTGTGTNNFANAGTWNTLGISTFGDSAVNNTGAINLSGPTTFGGLTTFTNSGTLNLAASGAVGTLTLPGNLALQSGALYIVALAPPNSSVIKIGGTASLAGSVQAFFLPGAYAKGDTFTIVQAAGRFGGTSFSGFSNPGFTGTLAYTPTDAMLTLTAAKLGAGVGLNVNQQNVANAINNFFNSGGTLPGNFAPPLFNLTGANLANGLSQVSGEVAADAEHGAFNMMTEFLNLMLDPFVDGRLGSGIGGGQAIGFAPEVQPNLPPDIALAYASILKAPPPAPFEQRWTTWGTSYGGGNWTNGNTATGSSNVAAQTYGLAAGMDYHYSPDTIFGFALGGGGTNWGLATGGTGRSDAFQTGVYSITRSGPAYLAGALAFANHWMTTNRGAFGAALTANFDAQSYGGRVEAGYRYASLPTFGIGVTPYVALQAQDFHTPAYGETDLNGGGFGLSYAAMNATDVRTELGGRFDDPTLIGGMPLVLRARLAWAHDFVSNPALDAAFESLPGASFVVNGAPTPQNSALASAGAELYLTPRITLLVKFDGEFAPGSQTYAGSGTLRYAW